MSVSDEEPYSTIFASLKHPIRRRILRMLSKKPMSFSEMLEVLGVSSSFLTYHLENLGELLGKTDDGRYKLSSFGEAAIATMTKVEDIPITAPQQRPRKVVRRSGAIALGIICVLLIAFIAYFSIAGISAENSYNNLQNQNTNLTNQVNDLTSTLNLDKSTVWVNNQTISQPANSYIEMYFLVVYSGYVSVNVQSSTTDTTYVKVIYTAHGIDYDNTITVGTNGTAIFPVLPQFPIPSPIQLNITAFSNKALSVPITELPPYATITPYTNIRIIVGNRNSVGNATETVTITYYY